MNVHQLNRTIDAESLMRAAMALAADPATSRGALGRVVDQILQLESSGSSLGLDSKCVDYADSVLSDTFERGWQPAELVHVVTRRVDKTAVPMLEAMIGSHSRRTLALSSAPPEWRCQLRSLAIDPSTDLIRHRRTSRIHPRTFWTSLFRLLVQLRYMGSMTIIAPPPSRWVTGATKTTGQRPDPKVLTKIRGLLAKAESTTFTEESDSLSAKAQELMTRYAIDSVVLDATESSKFDEHVVTRRIVVDNPYADAKMQLMSSVAHSNGARTVRYRKLGLYSITGLPIDLDLCELLYTSLLVQSAQALAHAGVDSATRSRGFRRAFLFGYAWRIGERLTEARARADRAAGESYGPSLVPILAERDRAVTSVFDDLFPDLVSSTISVSNRGGVAQGRLAAERADLTGGRETIED
ncbi:DUF2786 domain-containing protein [Rhodococcus sp. P1Y]|uniref:DUF2786 domain-containing protein n=1 Tax=Rhodococcus sp. P1Y TaxID=1302308 RepID=UPI000EAFC0DC|nr:DUF2786 domain-containing protein [Rhodococcus sp. P1Y]AYJ50447.1 DUF2786 domain-containing protein [Rhodococcus sp. P1Y]